MTLRAGFQAFRAAAAATACLACAVASAEQAPPMADLIVRRSTAGEPGGGAATFVTAPNNGVIPVNVPRSRQRLAGLAFWDQYGALFGITDPMSQLRLDSVKVDRLGYVHTTFQQVHRGVPVFSGVLKLHQNAAGQVVAANGHFRTIKPGLVVTPSIDEKVAANAARAAIREKCDPAVESAALWIVDPGWYGDAFIGARLAWKVIMVDANAGVREAFFIDAHTAAVLDQWSLIEQLLNRATYDGEQLAPIPGVLARSEGQPPVTDVEVNRAHDYAGDFYAYFQRAHGRDGVDDAGGMIIQTVNSRSTGCPNAYWNGFQAVYCTGVCTDDIVAHELTHGVIQETAALIYQNQSGQLNESFADVFGELVDLYNGDASTVDVIGGPVLWPDPPAAGPGTDSPNNMRTACSPRPFHPNGVRWCIGEDSAGFSGAIREMYDPTCRNDPDRANSPLMLCQPVNAGGVHHGSGVPNKAFAMLVDGGVFNGRTIIGIGAVKAGAIWYRALTTYLTPASDFKDAYDAFIQSATDLLGTFPNDPRTGLPIDSAISAFDLAQLTESLLATEMNTDGACGQSSNVLDETPPIECAEATVLFSETFESGPPAGWTVSNSGPPTPYDWALTTSTLPFFRPGVAFYCEARAVGDCIGIDESATHTLTSPPVAVPAGPAGARPVLAFSHYVASEGRYDGGRLEISVGAGPWTPIPRSAFEFNPYNNRLVEATFGNTNPLAAAGAVDVFSGAGGRWGRSVVDLRSFGAAGESVRFRWVFGKDGCGGGGAGTGWYIDDVAVYNCPDCDASGAADIDQLVYRASPGAVLDLGWLSERTVVLTSPPLASGPVTIEALAVGDYNHTSEYLDVYINNLFIGRLFEVAGIDCSLTPLRGALTVPEAVWNAAAGTGTVTILFYPTAFVEPVACFGTFLGSSIRYRLAAPDVNNNLVLDACECPFVTQHADPLTLTIGDTAIFTASALGRETLSYRWRRNEIELFDGPAPGGGTISGAATTTLTITNVGEEDEGDYTLRITNDCGSATTNPAALTVNPVCPTIDTPPAPLTIDAGQNAMFTVAASGSAPLAYQWRFNDVDLVDGPSAGGGTISGATSATLTITGAGFADEGPYRVAVSNGCPEPTLSDPALLTIDNPCPADFNESGVVSVQDIFDFLEAYFAGDPRADFNQSSVLSVQDIFDFLEAYFTGCA